MYQHYILSYSSMSYFGDAGGLLTLLYAIGKFLQSIIANEKVSAIMIAALYQVQSYSLDQHDFKPKKSEGGTDNL